MTKTQARKERKRRKKLRRIRIFLLAVFASVFVSAQQSSRQPISIVPKGTYDSMGFMLMPESPCKSAGVHIDGLTTDFYGLPVDPAHPSMGAIQYHDPTPDYLELVRNILVERHGGLTASQQAQIEARIDALFLKVYGYARGS
jgi:hypothetical protein